MTTFRRFCEYVDAAHKMRPKVPRDASYGQVVAALADAGFEGATAGELKTLAGLLRGLTETRRERTVLLKETIDLMENGIGDPEFGANAISGIVRADDIRGQTVLHDLRQFEGRNLYGAFGVKRISSCAYLISLGISRARNRAVA
jgi:hypothetical protein